MWHSATRDLALVLGASWLARIVFVAVVGDAHSVDVESWKLAVAVRAEGQNPYETGVLNWPPLWLEVIVVLDAVARHLDLAFLSVLRVYLVLVESAIVLTLYLTLVSIGARRDAVVRALLVGIAVNPVMIILVCQHGNSDVNVGLLVSLACSALIVHQRSRDVLVWLVGCLLLGLGVLAKTTPLALAPVLAPGARLASRTGRALGAALFLLPVVIGMSVIVALAPDPVREHVIGYRTAPGNFGFPGVLQGVTAVDDRSRLLVLAALAAVAVALWLSSRTRLGKPLSGTRMVLQVLTILMLAALLLVEVLEALGVTARDRYGSVFAFGLVAALVAMGYRLWREPPLTPESLYLLVALIFMVIVTFGTGYAAHYAPWFVPALIATYVLLDDVWRRLLLIGYFIAAATYAVEYALISFLGAYLDPIFDYPQWVDDAGQWLFPPHRWGLVRLPLVVIYVVVIAAGIARLHRLMTRSSGDSGERTSRPEGSPGETAPGRS
jgi:hypothetical protein